MIEVAIGAAVAITIVNLIFFFVGYYAGKDTLQEKVKKVFQARHKVESETGPVKPLNPVELSKKQSKELLDKYT